MAAALLTKPPLTLEERRQRKLEKREKQRAANLLRSQKMHEARLAAVETSAPAQQPPQLNIGCSGWFYWHWRGSFYPGQMPTKEWFSYYSERFNTVELNAPFYSWPTVNAVKTWLKQAGEQDFVYTVKVCELITHVKRLSRTRTLVEDFGYIADLLGERMGCFLYQFPPSHHYSPARLKAIVTQLDPHRRNVVEFRHRSWWNKTVYAAFKKANIIFCSCSGPRLPDELVVTTDELYVRFHGTTQWYRHDYTEEELVIWADRVKQSGATRLWAYFNNDRNAFAISNAASFRQMLTDSWAGSP